MKVAPLLLFVIGFLVSACAGPRAARHPAAPTAAEVTAGLLSHGAADRFQSARDHRSLSPADQEVVFAALFERLVSLDGTQFPEATEALATLGSPVVLKLMARFDGANDLIRYRVAWALCQMPAEAGDADYLMKAALRDSAPYVRYSAAIFLGRRYSNPDALVIDTLIGALNNKDAARFRYEALRALANTYPPRRAALAPVIRMLSDPELQVRNEAYRVLQRWVVAIEGQEAVEGLLASPNLELQTVGAILLAQTLDKRPVDHGLVERGLNSSWGLVREEAERVLSGTPAVPDPTDNERIMQVEPEENEGLEEAE